MSINKSMAHGAFWMISMKFFQRGIGLISNIILVRLLVPEDFGLIAMAMIIFGMLELFNSFGFDMVIIQNQKAQTAHYNTAWTFNLIFGVCMGLLMMLLAVPAALFYHDPRLTEVMLMVAILPILAGVDNIGTVDFRKYLEFNKEFKFEMLKFLARFAFTIPLAFWLQSYWALLWGMLFARLAGLILSYTMHPFRPKLGLSLWREFFHFSKWVFIINMGAFLKNRMTDLILGKVAGPHALGIYSLAYEYANLPLTEMAMPINRAIFPGFSRMSHDLVQLTQSLLNVVALLALAIIPAGLGMCAIASVLVPVLFGEKWLEAVPLMQILSIYGVVFALQNNNGLVYMALGKPRIVAYLSLVYVSILLPVLIYATLAWGMIGAAWAVLVVAAVFLVIDYTVLVIQTQFKIGQLLIQIWRPLVAGLLMYGIIAATSDYLVGNGTDKKLVLLILIFAGIVSYGLFVLLLWWLSGKPASAEHTVLKLCREKLNR